MGVLLGIVGTIIAALGFLLGFTTMPVGAIQQAVEGLFFVIGVLGLVVLAAGCVVHQLGNIADLLETANDLVAKAKIDPAAPATAPVVETY